MTRPKLRRFDSLKARGLLHGRVRVMLGFDQVSADLPGAATNYSSQNNPACLKIVISQATGQMMPTQNELNRGVLAANQAGFQAAIHAVEKDSVAAAVEALEFAQAALPEQYWRNRLEHCSECAPELLPRLAALRAIVVTQPPFLYFQGERYLAEVPPEIQAILYPFKSIQGAGVVVTGSSDAPIVDFNPLIGIYAAVCRRALSGQVLLPDQCMEAESALAMYTSQAAYTGFQEEQLGSLTPGKLADMAVLSTDPLGCDPEQIKDIQVEQTILGGQIRWDRR